MTLPPLDQVDLHGKTVFVRGDIDVPLTPAPDIKISDDTRLVNIYPTIDYLQKQNCRIVLAGHLGRPGGKVVPELSSQPVADWFSQKLSHSQSDPTQLNNFSGFKVSEQLTVLENLRFDPREESGEDTLAQQLAALADVYIDEAFAASERSHASITGVPKSLPHYAGLRLAQEIEVLSQVLNNPQRPLLVIIGGAKMETKIPVITKMAEVADNILVGGKLLNEIKIGDPIMGLPKVHLLKLTADTKDSTLESIDKYQDLIKTAATIVWNGPVGLVEDYTYQVGTRRIAELVANSSAHKILGGGDTIGFVNKLGLAEKFDWISSGGGAMLNFLSGEDLPGVKALEI